MKRLTDYPMLPTRPSQVAAFCVWPQRPLTVAEVQEREAMRDLGRAVANLKSRAWRLSTEGVKADMRAIGRGEK